MWPIAIVKSTIISWISFHSNCHLTLFQKNWKKLKIKNNIWLPLEIWNICESWRVVLRALDFELQFVQFPKNNNKKSNSFQWKQKTYVNWSLAMFFQQLHDFDFRPPRDARLARVNVELEQSAHTFDFWTIDGQVQRSHAIDVNRVLIDAVQRTHQLARARVAIITCPMQRRRTFFMKKRFWSWNKRHFP